MKLSELEAIRADVDFSLLELATNENASQYVPLTKVECEALEPIINSLYKEYENE